MGISIDPSVLSTTVPTISADQASVSKQLGTGDFLTLMIQELVNQDPLNPMNNQDLLNQVSQIQNVQTLTNLDKTLTGMTSQQGMATAGALIGKQVSGVSTADANVTGVVAKVTVSSTNGVTLVTTAGDQISLNNVYEITGASK